MKFWGSQNKTAFWGRGGGEGLNSRGLIGLSVLILILSISACDLRMESPLVEEIRERGTLVVLTRNAPTTFYEDRDQRSLGFEQDI